MKTLFRIVCVALALFILAACGTQEPKQTVAPSGEPAVVPTEAPTPAPTPAEEVVVEIVPSTETSEPEPTETPAPEETPEPTETPAPEETAEPSPSPSAPAPREGDIAVNFPDYDTGVNADYSYQSDELRIAITVHHETLPDNKDRQLNETYYVADIWVRNINSMRMAFAKGEFGKGSEEGETLARRENAILAVNGSQNQGFILQNGQVLQRPRANKGWNSGAVGILYQDGSLKTFHLKTEVFSIDREIANGAWLGWQFGPIIIRDGEKGPDATAFHNMGFKARNMLGYYEPGHYVIVTCDNRGDDAQGMNEFMMVDLMKSLGVREAFNLDGGTSAVMVFMGEVINHPTLRTDNGSRVEGRPLTDMLLFGEYNTNP